MLGSEALRSAFSARMLKIFGLRPPKRLGLSVSGGVDSMALASLTSDWARPRNVDLHAFVVNHNLRCGSGKEAASVSQALQTMLNIESSVLELDLGSDPSRVEELARAGRRSVLEQACGSANISELLMGHHLNDQIELFIHRLIRGSHWFGLAGMAEKSLLRPIIRPNGAAPVTLVRPLLQFQKQDLQSWCTDRGIPWWEDPTNQDISLTKRNLIRRMYSLGEEPPDFSVDEIGKLIAFLGHQRGRAEHMAQLAYNQLITSGRLKYRRGEAELQLGDDIRALSQVVRMELLFRVLAPISPYSEEKLFTRRHRLRGLADAVKHRRRQIYTAFGVVITGTKEAWSFYREKARQNQQAEPEVFQAFHKWSRWTLIDNRWWIRWKLSKKEKSASKFFSVRMLAEPDPALLALAAYVPESKIRTIRRTCVSHPFFMWSDHTNPDSVDYSNFIGFPTLNISRDLVVEVKPKEFKFDN